MATAVLNNKIWQYLELCKFKVVLLMLFSSLVGMLLLYSAAFPWQQALLALLGIGLTAGSGGAFNHILDKKIDIKMSRTKNRPLATGSLPLYKVIIFASSLLVSGALILWFYTNPTATFLTVAAMMGYAFIYTGILKHLTPQNIVIGGINGAIPPLLGWVSITGKISTEPLLLMLIIFVWTPPHFWALAIAKYDDYIKSNVPMLPATHGIPFTKLCILLYTILTVICTILPYLINMLGEIYLFGVSCLNARFFYLVWQLYKEPGDKYAMPTFTFSITYLMLLFFLVLADHFILPRV